MSKNISPEGREYKEKGYRIYKTLVHIFTIFGLYALYQSLWVTHDGNHWLFGVGVIYLILKLAMFTRRERKAAELDIPVTEYMERRQEELRNKNKNN